MTVNRWKMTSILRYSIYLVWESWYMCCGYTYIWKWKLLSRVLLWDPKDYSPWNSLDRNTGMGSLSLLQGIFPTQGPNPGLPHCRQILYQLSHKGNPRILAWVAYPFSSRSSQPRNWTGVSCIAGGFFITLAIREAHQKRSQELLQSNRRMT